MLLALHCIDPLYSTRSFGNGILVTIITSTMEFWTVFVYWFMDAEFPASVTFFVLVVGISNWLILSLFTSVMMTEFSTAWDEYLTDSHTEPQDGDEQALAQDQQGQLADAPQAHKSASGGEPGGGGSGLSDIVSPRGGQGAQGTVVPSNVKVVFRETTEDRERRENAERLARKARLRRKAKQTLDGRGKKSRRRSLAGLTVQEIVRAAANPKEASTVGGRRRRRGSINAQGNPAGSGMLSPIDTATSASGKRHFAAPAASKLRSAESAEGGQGEAAAP